MSQTAAFGITAWRRNSILFLISQFVTGITSMVVQYAIIWYLTLESGSATVLSQATLLGMLPMVLLSPFIGTFVDRWNKKALLIVPDVIAAAVAVVLSVVGTMNTTFPLWLVFVSLLVRSGAQTFQMPTIQSIIPTLVPQDEITKVNGQLGMVQSATMVISPALGALLYGLIPINVLILIDVLGAVLGIALLIFVYIPSNMVEASEKPHVLADAAFGAKQIGTVRGLWTLLLINSLFTLLLMPVASMYPLITVKYFHGTIAQAGIVEVVWSVGSLVGGGLIGLFGNWNNRMKPVIYAMLSMAVMFAACGWLQPNFSGFVIFTVLNALAGMAISFPNIMFSAMVQQSFAPEQLGRVFGVILSVSGLSGPVGLIFAGPIADSIGVQYMMVIAGVGALLCGVLMFIFPSTRNYDRRLQEKLAMNIQSAEPTVALSELDAQ